MAEKQIGFTDLIGRSGVSKAEQRFEAIGAIDEASAAISLAKSFCEHLERRELLERSQQDLSMIMSELAGMKQFSFSSPGVLSPIQQALAWLESTVAELKTKIGNPRKFIFGGSNQLSGALNLARAVTRRAEREVLRLYEAEGPTDEAIAQYLNRLSLMIFLLEIEAETKAG